VRGCIRVHYIGAGDFYYAISFHEEIDGKHSPLDYALEKAVGFGMPSLISCLPDRLAYFESEQVFGPPERFILKNLIKCRSLPPFFRN
jgi:hypothetical protein